MTRFAHWGDNEKDFVVRHLGSKPDESYVCKRDLLEAKRHHDTPNHIPKWKNPNSKPIAKYNCSHPKCTVSEGLIQPKFESTDSIGAALGIKHSPGYPLLLCREHYNTVYTFIPKPLVLLAVPHPEEAPVFHTTVQRHMQFRYIYKKLRVAL